MKYVFLTLAILGIIDSSLALREHYREYGDSPCHINERWDCGVVNHSPFAMVGPIPVAALGIFGYLLMAALSVRHLYRMLLIPTLAGFIFSLYLSHIEKDILGVWCLYCVISLGTIALMSLLNVGVVIARLRRPSSP